MAHHTAILLSAAAALLLTLFTGATAAPAPMMGMPGCNTSCGKFSVPYPFGMGSSYCYHSPGFNLTCDRSSNPPRLLLGDGTLQVSQDIDLSFRWLTVVYTGDIRTDGSGMSRRGTLHGGLGDGGPYMLSGSENELILVGCNVRATLKNGNITMGSCSSVCQSGYSWGTEMLSRRESSMFCSGIGCCQGPIVVNREVVAGGKKFVPITSYDVELKSFGWNRSDDQQCPPRLFVAKKGWFATSSVSHKLYRSEVSMEVPVLLDWEVIYGHGEDTHHHLQNSSDECPWDAAGRVCKSTHANCRRGDRGGYRCFCKEGYDGNPYITNGCQDINECEYSEDRGCYGQCINTDGSFQCRCPKGTRGDPNMPGGCSRDADNCSRVCGNVEVPYPFGFGPHKCYLPGFNLTCDTSHHPPRLMLGTLRVVDIAFNNNTMRVINTVRVRDNYGVSSSIQFKQLWTGGHGDLVPYSLSTRNELIVIGCGVQAGLSSTGGNRAILSGCSSFCYSNKSTTYDAMIAATMDDDDEYCYGMGCCCKAGISKSRDGMPSELWIDWMDPNNASDNGLSYPYALIAEEGSFDKRRVLQLVWPSINDPADRLEFPIVLDWEVLHLHSDSSLLVANGSWRHRKKQYSKCPGICSRKNSLCKQMIRGYVCQCTNGHFGNPYLVNGCKGVRRKYFKESMGLVIGAGLGILGILIIILPPVVVILKINAFIEAKDMKKRFFKQNRGQLLQQLVSQRTDVAERMIITLEELKKATNNFDKTHELGGGGHGIVYKGILSDLHVVAIKKSKIVIQQEINEFINEVVILSQINHKNIVRLLGCCLEVEVPLLVYEFISNGTLNDHLHVNGQISLSWDKRLKIGSEIAKALAFLHSATLIPVIHRDIKSTNILLDDTLTVKVSDFGASRYIEIDKTGVTTKVQGTIGYLDPTYYQTGRLTEKSDVYSFGVVLVELLTRKKPYLYLSPEDDMGLIEHFVTLLEENKLVEILDPQIVEEGGEETKQVAAIAASCIGFRGEDRPTMRQVEMALECIQASKERVSNNYITQNVASNLSSAMLGGTRVYSLEQEFLLSATHPR